MVGGCSLGKPAPIALSEDDGATWTLADFTSRRDFSGVTADARGDLWVSGAKGALLTRRGGRWKRQRTTLPEGLSRVWCGASGGVYVCRHKGALARSLDDGRTWEVSARATNAGLFGICSDGCGTFVAVGRQHVVLRSDDGARWEVVPASGGIPEAKAHETLSAMQALRPGRFLAGGGGVLLCTDDGGRAWRDVTPRCLKERGGISSICTPVAQAHAINLVSVSKVALHLRMRTVGPWLSELAVGVSNADKLFAAERWGGYRIYCTDAT